MRAGWAADVELVRRAAPDATHPEGLVVAGAGPEVPFVERAGAVVGLGWATRAEAVRTGMTISYHGLSDDPRSAFVINVNP